LSCDLDADATQPRDQLGPCRTRASACGQDDDVGKRVSPCETAGRCSRAPPAGGVARFAGSDARARLPSDRDRLIRSATSSPLCTRQRLEMLLPANSHFTAWNVAIPLVTRKRLPFLLCSALALVSLRGGAGAALPCSRRAPAVARGYGVFSARVSAMIGMASALLARVGAMLRCRQVGRTSVGGLESLISTIIIDRAIALRTADRERPSG